jgi:hypothetical protein
MNRRWAIRSGYGTTIIASLIFSFCAHAATYMTGNEVLPMCKMTVQQLDAKQNDGSLIDQLSIGYCLGAIHALRTASLILTNSGFRLKTCVPKEANDLQAVRVAIDFMEKNPSRLHEPFEFLVLESMNQAWPCQK